MNEIELLDKIQKNFQDEEKNPTMKITISRENLDEYLRYGVITEVQYDRLIQLI